MTIIIFGGDTPLGAAFRTHYLSQGRNVIATRTGGGDAEGWIECDLSHPEGSSAASAALAEIEIDFVVFTSLIPQIRQGGLPVWIEAFSQNALAVERCIQMTRVPMASADRPRFVVAIDTPRRGFPMFDVVRGARTSEAILSSARRATEYSSKHRRKDGVICTVYYHPDLRPQARKPVDVPIERLVDPLTSEIDALTIEDNGKFEVFPDP